MTESIWSSGYTHQAKHGAQRTIFVARRQVASGSVGTDLPKLTVVCLVSQMISHRNQTLLPIVASDVKLQAAAGRVGDHIAFPDNMPAIIVVGTRQSFGAESGFWLVMPSSFTAADEFVVLSVR